MSIATYTKTGTKATTAAKLDKDIYGLEVRSHELVKQAYVAYLSNARNASANVKTRGLVRGGGKKPWKQKGTGRARFGSSRNPIWRGGGIVFGPTGGENYTKKLPTTAKRTAIRQELSMSNTSNQVAVIEAFVPKDNKTSEAAKLLAKVNAKGRVLIVVDKKEAELERSVANLQKTQIVSSMYLNVYDVLNADMILIEKKALETISVWLGETKKETK
jgi:large subunit ribosomal protein L4